MEEMAVNERTHDTPGIAGLQTRAVVRTTARVLLCAVTLMATAVYAAEPQAPRVESNGYTLELPLGLQADSAYIPETNPMTAAKVELGTLLYFDPRLSIDGTISCASCHNPFHGFAEPEPTGKGVRGQRGNRNSPTVINRLFSKEQFWDGRAADLEDQAHGPLTNPIEMAMPSHDEVVKKVASIAGYGPYFKQAFGSAEVTMPRIAQAIASYERTVISGNSPFDRYAAGDKAALSPSAVRGMALFNGTANCKTCHAGFNFTDEQYHNLGVGMDKPEPDLGRYAVTKADVDRGAFKTPTLRNVVQSGPYMHDGSEVTLEGVVALYNRGGVQNTWLSKEMKPLHLTPTEVDDLVAFMLGLTGEVHGLAAPPALPK
jgi:cytochrome c peroxidase